MGSLSVGIAAGRGASKSPKQTKETSVSESEHLNGIKAADDSQKSGVSNVEVAKPLAPPPRPSQHQQGHHTPDYFSGAPTGSLSLEPNPFEQSFGGAPPETPGGTKLPPVASLTSPSSLLPTGATPFGWGGGSLRSGPLSPAMLSGPQGDYFSDTHHIRGGFPTPNESSLRTGLTPGGSGSMFPAQSPNTQALFSQLGGATPGTIDFHRTAMSAAAVKRDQAPLPQSHTSSTTQQVEMTNGVSLLKAEPKPASGTYDPHDNDAANGLFMLAQGRNGTQVPPTQPPTYAPAPPQRVHTHQAISGPGQHNTSPQMNDGSMSAAGSSIRGVSESSAGSDKSEQTRPSAKTRGKRNSTSTVTNGRRKAEDNAGKGPANKRVKPNNVNSLSTHENEVDMYPSDDEDDALKHDENGSKSKMTDEEKRKNFLERNRVAALKCRQRKKQWLANLQSKVELYSSENDHLTAQISQLREEVVNLKTLLLAHKDCPVTQQQGLSAGFMHQPPMEQFNQQMNPYGMAASIPNQPVMAGQGVNRRFS